MNPLRRLRDWLDRRTEDRLIGRCMLCGRRRSDRAVIQQAGADVWVHLECPGTADL